MLRLGNVKVGTGSMVTGVGQVRQESTIKNITFFDFRSVEEDRKGDRIEKTNNSRVRRNKRARRHISYEDCGLVFMDSVLKELVPAFMGKV